MSNGHKYSEDTMGLEFAHRHNGKFIYCSEIDQWYKWDSFIWRPDLTNKVLAESAELCRKYTVDAIENSPKIARSLSSTNTISAVVRRAGYDSRIVRRLRELDANPMLLGTPGGTVDLSTGELRAAVPADLITMCTAVTPGEKAECPKWKEFLRTTFPLVAGKPEPDQPRIDFIQKFAGYSLTGEWKEERVPFLIGEGRNGKNVLTEAMFGALGDYAGVMAPETLQQRTNEPHRAELAVLRGKRFITTNEVSKSKKWNQARLAELSGGGFVTCNLMRQNPISFRFIGKIWVSVNSSPKFESANTAMSERITLVRFLMRFFSPDNMPDGAATDPTIAIRDSNLKSDLRSEYPAILRWMIDGCVAWKRDGLKVPADVVEASRALVADSNPLSEWIADSCRKIGLGDGGPFTDMWKSLNLWQLEQGEQVSSRTEFKEMLSEAGYTVRRKNAGRRVLGLSLSDIALRKVMDARKNEPDEYASN